MKTSTRLWATGIIGILAALAATIFITSRTSTSAGASSFDELASTLTKPSSLQFSDSAETRERIAATHASFSASELAAVEGDAGPVSGKAYRIAIDNVRSCMLNVLGQTVTMSDVSLDVVHQRLTWVTRVEVQALVGEEPPAPGLRVPDAERSCRAVHSDALETVWALEHLPTAADFASERDALLTCLRSPSAEQLPAALQRDIDNGGKCLSLYSQLFETVPLS